MNLPPPVQGNLQGAPWCDEKNTSLERKYGADGYGYGYCWTVVLISLVILTTLFPAGVSAVETPDPSVQTTMGNDTIIWGPYLTSTTHNSTTINWKTLGPSIGRVGFVLSGINSPGIPGQDVSEESPSVLHRVQLNNLEPGQRYSYWIGNSSKNYSCMTFPTDGSFMFVVYGDTREQLPDWSQSELHARVAERIAMEQDCLFVVHTGDLVNDPADDSEWGRFFEAAGPMLANTTFCPVPGNHEGDLLKYHEYFGVPPWYNFTVSGSEFIILNSNTQKPMIEDKQDGWLNQTLSGPSNSRFVFLHHPLYTSEPNHWGGFLNIRNKWELLFIEHNVLGVFSAHVHAYEHFYENGIHYATIGTGGAPFYPLAKKKPEGYRSSMENTLAYARVTVNIKSGLALIEVIKVADIHDGQIMMSPPGTIAERIIISGLPEKTPDTLKNSLPAIYPLFKTPLQFST